MAAKRGPRKLAATVGDHFVDVHVELGTAAGHPDMQGKHVVVPAGENLIAGLNDQFVSLVVKPLTRVIRGGRGLLQGGVGCYHLAGNQILADTEVLKRALGLRPPQLVRRHLDHSEAIGFFSHLDHGSLLDLLGNLPTRGAFLARCGRAGLEALTCCRS